MNEAIQKLSDTLLSALGKMAGDMLSSPLGIGLLAVAAFLFIFPVARSIWRTSRYLFGGVILLLIAVAMFRPEMPKRATDDQALATSPARQSQDPRPSPVATRQPSAGEYERSIPTPSSPQSECPRCGLMLTITGEALAKPRSALQCCRCDHIFHTLGIGRMLAFPTPRVGEITNVQCYECFDKFAVTWNGGSRVFQCKCGNRQHIVDGSIFYESTMEYERSHPKPTPVSSSFGPVSAAVSGPSPFGPALDSTYMQTPRPITP